VSDSSEPENETATAPAKPARSPLFVVVAALIILGLGTWVLWDMRAKPTPRPDPSERLKILGRDDEAARREDQETNRRGPASSSATPSASASAAPSASAP
jgi:hypothetical protein